MANVTNLKRLIKEDFPQEYQDLVDKIAFSFNPLTEQLTQAFNHGIDFNNLNQEYTTFTLKVDASGVSTTSTELKHSLKTRIKGLHCIRAENLTDNTPLNGAPFISFTTKNDIIQITQVTGLVADKQYRLSLVIIG